MEICRACLTIETEMVLVDDVLINNFNIVTNLNITLSKEMPQNFCNSCHNAIQFCAKFIEKCITSDMKLKELLLPKEVKEEEEVNGEVNVKWEYESDPAISDDFYADPFDMIDSTNTIENKKEEDFPPIRRSKRHKTIVETEPKEKNATKVKLKKKPTKVKPEAVADDNKLEHCGICSEKMEGIDNLLKHLERHKLDKYCGMCPETFLDFTHIFSHRIKHIPKEQRKCHICCEIFLDSNSLEFHYVKNHYLRGGDGQLQCKQCKNTYDTPKKLENHVKNYHPNSDVTFQCNDCQKVCFTKEQLRIHMRCHNKKTYTCGLCEYTAKYPSSLREHKVRKHTEGRVYCKPCGRAFPSKEILAQHNCKHLAEVICPFCGIYVRKLTRHMKIHTNKFLYKCELCPSQFKNAANFRAHQNKHQGKRTFHCQYCTMSFYTQSVLIKHRRTHTGEKPYVCKLCNKGFTSNHNLKVHMKVHGQYLVVKKNLGIFG